MEEKNELVDLPLAGRKFTWPTVKDRLLGVGRIDFLLSKEWEDHFSGAIRWHHFLIRYPIVSLSSFLLL